MYKIILTIVIFSLSLIAKAQTNNDPILGKWTNEDKSRVLEFIKSGSGYEAVIIKAEDQSLIGKKQITSLRLSNEKGFYEDGVLHIFQKNKTAFCSVKILDSESIELKATIGMFSKKQKWSKYNE